MTATVHAAIGAGLGGLLKDPTKAFVAGVISHHFTDRMPHKEAPPARDIPMAIAALAFLRIRYGRKSPQLWGALGALAPDFEHILAEIGVLPKGKRFFPTHRNSGELHGEDIPEYDTQVLAAFLGGLLAEIGR